MLLPVTSIARISSVCSSRPMWILRQRRRLGPPCLRAFHSPSPSALMSVLSTRKCRGPLLSPDRQWQQTRSFAVDTACCHQQRPNRDRPTSAGFPRTRSSVAAAGQTTLLSSDRLGLQHRITWLAATFARGPSSPIRLGIKTDRKGSALLQGMMINRPIPSLVCRRGQLLIPNRCHAGFTLGIPVIHHLCNKAPFRKALTHFIRLGSLWPSFPSSHRNGWCKNATLPLIFRSSTNLHEPTEPSSGPTSPTMLKVMSISVPVTKNSNKVDGLSKRQGRGSPTKMASCATAPARSIVLAVGSKPGVVPKRRSAR